MDYLQRDEAKEDEQAPGKREARENPQPSCGHRLRARVQGTSPKETSLVPTHRQRGVVLLFEIDDALGRGVDEFLFGREDLQAFGAQQGSFLQFEGGALGDQGLAFGLKIVVLV